MQWNDLKIILAIGRAGSLTGAARLLEQNHSTVFRQINAIEKSLGVRLFERLSTGYVKTEAGEAAVEAAERIDEEIHGLTRKLAGKDKRLQGKIRLTAPEGITQTILMPLLAKFSKQHPDIEVDLVVTSIDLELSRREADVALRVTAKPPDTSVGRCISRFNFAVYATQAYLAKHKQASIEEHDWLLADDARNWFSNSDWKKIAKKHTRTVLSSNNIMAILNACKNSLGIALLPCFLGDSEKKLIRVKEPQINKSLELWILTHPDLRYTARVRALKQFLFESMAQHSALFAGECNEA